jgi:hypothetical protein
MVVSSYSTETVVVEAPPANPKKTTKTKKAKRALPKPPPSQPKRPAVKARPATALDEFEMLEAMAGRESVSTPMLVSRLGMPPLITRHRLL